VGDNEENSSVRMSATGRGTGHAGLYHSSPPDGLPLPVALAFAPCERFYVWNSGGRQHKRLDGAVGALGHGPPLCGLMFSGRGQWGP
jgi:hypothetical protein